MIAAITLPSALAAKEATSTIPIVFYSGGDPVEEGLVTSFSRPGGNLTGISLFLNTLGPKRLELIRELGWIEGKNIVIEFRWADRVDELPALAAELVRMHVDVIFASSSPWSCRVNLPNAPRRWPSLRRHRTSGWPRPRRKGRKRGRVFIEYTWPNLTTLDFPEIGAPGRTTAKSRSKWFAPMLRSRQRER